MILGALVIVILGVIVVNYFRNQGQQGQLQTGISTESTENKEQPTIAPGKGPVDYMVSSGETLWSIAMKQYGSGYNWVDIAKENKLTNPNQISAGQKLSIPDVAPIKPATNNQEPTSTPPGSASSTSAYTVVKGDTLWAIAVKTYGDGYQWPNIAKANNLINPNLIHSGNKLTLPK